MLKTNNKWLMVKYLLVFLLTSSSALADLTEARKHELQHLIKHDCGSCHGMTLKGGLGPSLLPESLKEKPDELLFITIREGRPGTPMPPWKPLLSEDDVNWIIRYLRKDKN